MITKFHKAILTRFSRLFQRRVYQTHIQMQHTPNLRLKTAKTRKFRPAFNNDFHTHTKSAPQNRTNALSQYSQIDSTPHQRHTPIHPISATTLTRPNYPTIFRHNPKFCQPISFCTDDPPATKITAKTDKNALKSV